MKYLVVGCALLLAATVATYARYASLDPCDWMEQDMAETSGLPLLLVQARIRGAFLLDGTLDPGPTDCLLKWWDFRANGLPEA